MPSSILGKKLGMTQIFEEGGRVTPVTVICCRSLCRYTIKNY